MAHFLKRFWPQITVAALTFGLRLIFYFIFSSHWSFQEAKDWDGWGRIASFLSQGHGFADTYRLTYFPLGDVPVPTAARSPLPILIFAGAFRLFGESLLPIVMLQAFIDSVTALLIYLISRNIFKDGSGGNSNGRFGHTVGLLAALAFACFLPGWFYDYGFASEPLFNLLLTGALGLATRDHTRLNLAATGILFGLAALSRPTVILFPLILVPWLTLGRSVTLKRAILVPLLMGLMLVPWGIRNYVVFNRFMVKGTLGGYNLYRHNSIIEEDNYLRLAPKYEGNEMIQNMMASRGLSPGAMSEPEMDLFLSQEAYKIIVAHPWKYINLVLHRMTWMFSDAGQEVSPILRAGYIVFSLALFGLNGLALWRYRGEWVKQLVPVWMILGYITTVHALIISQFRYLIPEIPLLLSVCAYAAVRAYGELHALIIRNKECGESTVRRLKRDADKSEHNKEEESLMDRPIRVLMLTSEWPSPDLPHAVPFLVQQVDFLRRAGVEVDVFSFRGSQNPINYLKAWRRLRKQLDPERYDLVHAQFGQSALLAWPRRLPLVMTFHGDDILGIKGEGGRLTFGGRILQRLCQLMSLRADAVIIVSDQMRDHIPPSVPLHLLPTGVDLDSLPVMTRDEARHQMGLPLDERLVLFVGNPEDPYKRYELAKQSVDILNERLPARLVLGWRKTHSHILVLMNACDALVVSSHQEGSPTVVKEALACNLPVVSVVVGDVALRLKGVEGCEVCADDNPETIARALERTLVWGKRSNGRETVRELDEKVLARKMIGIYRAVMKKSAAGKRLGDRDFILSKQEEQ
jgi:glycosyltransferase involved in cell wall biosynthesis